MAGIELATGYVSLVSDASAISKEIDKALGAASTNVDRHGATMGSRMGSAIATTLKASAAATGAAVAGVIGTAAVQGFSRLRAIDDAEGKLASLGHTSVSTAKIMDSALDSVRGTAFGLGDAATLAATAVAAGVQPGKDLTEYLSLVADSSAIAGVELAEMGSIFGKVQTNQRAFTGELDMLADRGIPIYQYLQDELGVTAEELRKMVVDGKVDSETYFRALENNLGGAAKSTNTFSAAWSNTMAALGRAGAAGLEPTFDRLQGGLLGITSVIDDATPAIGEFADSLDAQIFNVWVPRALDAAAATRELYDEFAASPMVVDSIARIEALFDELGQTWDRVWPAGQKIAGSLAEAAASTGVTSWQLLLNLLEAAVPILDATLVPALELTADVMERNQGAVTALVLAYGAFKTIPAIMSAVVPSIASLTATQAAAAAGTAGATTGLNAYQRTILATHGAASASIAGVRGFGTEVRNTQAWAAAAGRPIGTLTAGVLTLGETATNTGRALGTHLANGARTAYAALGGGVGLAIMGTVGAYTAINAEVGKSRRMHDLLTNSTEGLMQAQYDLRKALNDTGGSLDDAGIAAFNEKIRESVDLQSELASQRPGWERWQTAAAGWLSLGRSSSYADDLGDRFDTAERAEDIRSTLEDLQITNEELAAGIRGTDSEFASLTGRLDLTTLAGQRTSTWMAQQRNELIRAEAAARELTPSYQSIAEMFAVMGDEAASAQKQSDALYDTLRLIAGVEPDEKAAVDENNSLNRQIQQAAPIDQARGASDQLIVDGQVSTVTENGQALSDQLDEMIRNATTMARAGIAVDDVFANLRTQIEQTAETFGVEIPEVQRAIESLGWNETVVRVTTQLEGAGEVEAQLATIWGTLQTLDPDEPKVVRIDAEGTEDAQRKLDELGISWQIIRGADGEDDLVVNLDDEEARRKFDEWVLRRDQLLNFNINAGIDLDIDEFDLKAGDVEAFMAWLDRQEVLPGADLDTSEFEGARSLTIEQLNELSGKVTRPEVFLEIAQALADGQSMKAILDSLQSKTIQVTIQQSVQQHGAWSPQAINAWAEATYDPRFGRPAIAERAQGGPLHGPGGPTSDSIPMWGSDGEHMWTAAEVDAVGGHDRMYELRGMARRGVLRRAQGGPIVDEAISAVRSVDGNTYLWGRTGPDRFDCSGLVGWVQQILMGLGRTTKRLYTTYSLLAGDGAGLVPGLSSESPFNVGVSQEHMAATLAGMPVESGGAHGTSGIGGGRAGATDGQFTHHFHLPPALFAGGLAGGSMYSPATQWTDEDELDLQEARLAVAQAIEARDTAAGREGTTDTDRQQADLRIQRAELKVRELEAKRAGGGGAFAITPAPELGGSMSDDDLSLRRAELALIDAQLDRDRTHSDPASTPMDKERSDLAVYDARNSLDETRRRLLDAGGADEPRLKSVREIGQDLTGILIDGLLDELGLGDSVLADPTRLTRPDTSVTGGFTDRDLTGGGDGSAVPTMTPPARHITPDEAMGQLPFTPGHEAPGELDRLLSGAYGAVPAADAPWMQDLLARNPFDRGGEASGIGFLPKNILEPERVLEPRTTANFERLTRALDSGALLDRLDMPAPRGGGDTYAPTFQGGDSAEMFRMFERWMRQHQRGGGQRTRATTSRNR
ncbi:hypothetical protein DW322_00950 [Rhodococcus rhodnii]|uniref:Tape measure protein N-terminal domain-containing protein n=2 Tax=Rhodococcus rhodnii TaxID=38312 RepID=R7WPR9_9NOCA|nr:tape measure protein [Rhodococcus rhodnii]EOM77275.1 hypothetical protein Rrhod_1364 [Rhodococcus rhodnii LMG 5362]TXG89071.1 hypothetical protein DW322_00950 [Rhodococcus rhodnii]